MGTTSRSKAAGTPIPPDVHRATNAYHWRRGMARFVVVTDDGPICRHEGIGLTLDQVLAFEATGDGSDIQKGEPGWDLIILGKTQQRYVKFREDGRNPFRHNGFPEIRLPDRHIVESV